jgi:hypothetical protein
MNKKIINSKKHYKIFVLFLLFNLFLGVLLIFFLITNVEWNSILANIIFPIFVFIVAIKSCSYAKREFEKNEKQKITIACIPSFFISILYFMYYLFFLTIGLLSLMFSISEEQHKIKIQSDSVIGGSGILSLAMEKQLVLYAGHLNHPIWGKTPLCYKAEPYKSLTQIPPAPKMPDNIIHPESEAISSVQIDK